MSSSSTLPPLYFEDKSQQEPTGSALMELPSELLIQCLAKYASMGDLAKLSCVTSGWSGLLKDAAAQEGIQGKWKLAKAMLDGTDGLARNPDLALKYLLELTGNMNIDEDDDDDNEEGDADGEVTYKTLPQNVFVPAMSKLATCYLVGDGVEQDPYRGLQWMEKAATVGHDVEAAHELAILFEYGQYDVPVDVVRAAKWFRHAAQRGHVEAMAEYAMCCELGCGREQSDADALEWYVRAANAGHVTSSFSVGEAYEEAKGVPQSDEEACLWYYKAAVMGDEDSKRALQRLSDVARLVVPGARALLNAEL
jgi:TPR repeat protein